MTTFESTVRQINYPQQQVFDMLSDLTNIEKVRDKLPEDKIKDLHFDADTLSVHTPVGDIKMRIVEREVPKTIKFASEESMVSFNFWIQLVAVDAQTSKMKLTIKADLNPFIKGMVAKPLQEGIEKIADVLQFIHYE